MSERRVAIWCEKAYAALQQGDIRAAAKAADRARDANRAHPRVLLLEGHLLILLGRYEDGSATLRQAEAVFQKAGAVPAQLYLSLAVAAMKAQNHAEANRLFLQAHNLAPDLPEAVIGLGTNEMDRGDDVAAGYWFTIASKKWPAVSAVRWGRSMWRLRSGDWPAAWADYELRLCQPDWIMRWGRGRSTPQWYGQPIPGCTLLVHHEQGMGDSVMLSRYLPWVREHSQCSTLQILVPVELITLFKPLGDLVDWQAPANAPADYAVPFSSLPYIHGTRLDNVPPPILAPTIEVAA